MIRWTTSGDGRTSTPKEQNVYRVILIGGFVSKHRKSKNSAYAVRLGRTPGIYTTWDECKEQVHKFKGAEYKGFVLFDDAVRYMGNPTKPKKSKAPSLTQTLGRWWLKPDYDRRINSGDWNTALDNNG